MSVKGSLSYFAGLCLLSMSQCQNEYASMYFKLCRQHDGNNARLPPSRFFSGLIDTSITSLKNNSKPSINTQLLKVFNTLSQSIMGNNVCFIIDINQLTYQCKTNMSIWGQTQYKNGLRCSVLTKESDDQVATSDKETKTLCEPPCENSGHCNEHGKCECQPNYHGNFCENVLQKSEHKMKTKDDCTSQIWTLLAGIFIGICIGVVATSVVCCCLAESVVGCRKRINGCQCCRTDGHVIEQRNPESAGPSSSGQDVTLGKVRIYDEADDISTPRIGRAASVHTYETLQVRHDRSRYDMLSNGAHGEIAIDGTSTAKEKEPIGNKIGDSIELEEVAKIDGEHLDTASTDTDNTSIDNTTAATENTAIGNPSPFYFTLAKVGNAVTSSPSQFRPVHIADDTQCAEDDRSYFILEKEIADSESQHVSVTTAHMTHGNIDDASECAGTDESENNSTRIECVEDK